MNALIEYSAVQRRRLSVVLSIGLLGVAVAGCGQVDQPGVAPDSGASDRPSITVDLSEYPEEVRARAAKLIDAVNNAPNDAQSAGLAGMFAHAYEHPNAALAYYARAGELEAQSAAWPYLAGIVHESQGNDDKAMAAYENAASRAPDYPPLRLRMAQIEAKTGDRAKALAALAALNTDTPGYAKARYAYGKLALDLGDTDTAIEQLKVATQRVPHYGAAHYALAAAYEAAGDESLAATHRALFEKHRRGGPPDQDRMLTRVQDIRNSSRQSTLRAGRLSAEGRFREAIDEFEGLIVSEPENIVARINLIGLYGRIGEHDKAQASYEAGVAIAPETAKLHSNYGVLMMKLKRYEEAVQAFEKTLEIDASSASAHKYLGLSQQRLGQTENAFANFERAVELDPLDYQSGYLYGGSLIGKGDFDGAADVLSNIVEPVSNKTPAYLRLLAQAYFGAGNLDTAGDALNRARELATQYNQTAVVGEIDEELAQLAEASGS